MPIARVVEIQQFGGPGQMTVVNRDVPAPERGQVQVAHSAIGVNFLDISQREGGGYKLPLPTGLGHEAAGRVVELGAGVRDVKVGDRVACMGAGVGAYSDLRNVPADKLVILPDTISDEVAASVLFKGLTAQYLIRKTYHVEQGDLLLVHAATGGVGQILTRWSTALGATVIGTTSSPHKRQAGLMAGCDEVIALNHADWPEAFLRATNGRKAEVVYDSVGKATLRKSLECAARFGLVVCYGAASGPAPAIEPMLLNQKGGLFLTQPSVFLHNSDTEDFRANVADLFDAIEKGQVQVDIGARYCLKDIAEAHHAIEQHRVVGATVITP